VDASSTVRTGERAKLWVDTRKLHIFDPSDGSSMTLPREEAAPAAAPAAAAESSDGPSEPAGAGS
jgi:multiple sugar transport system ATP-binding protein